MKFSVYQYQMSREVADRVNANGWDVAAREFPEVNIHHGVKWQGSEKWEPEFFPYYNLVAEMSDISGLEEVFHIGNGYGDQSKIERVAKMYSMSVGDIIFCHDTNTWLMCDPEGWMAIKVSDRVMIA